ncbi:hypothetical protein B0H13DRAFT_1884219 [Mycena leptocephala]|nr:hypothetical protein B0H13DRAFT_1884219 [Mycena leptocephala]
MRYTVDAEDFDYDWNFMMNSFAGTGLALAAALRVNRATGIYINLFLLALHTHSRRRKAPGTKILIVATCVMAVLGTTQMAIGIAQAMLEARFVQQAVHAHVWELPLFNVLIQLYRCYVIWGFQRKILILPALLMLSTFVAAILNCTLGGAVNRFVGITQIPYILGVATNLVLTAFTGEFSSIINLAGYYGSAEQHRMLVSKPGLESGAIYCVMAILLAIFSRLTPAIDADIYDIASAIAPQLMNIIPTLTLVYIGLTSTAETTLPSHVMCHVRCDRLPPFALGPVQSFESPQVLDIKVRDTEEEDPGVV